jgi:CheY-like chemotaxis protein
MPGMDGLEATRRIRDLPPPQADVPIVALTADVMTHHQAAYRAAGMNGFVPKPFSPGQLLAEIVRIAG